MALLLHWISFSWRFMEELGVVVWVGEDFVANDNCFDFGLGVVRAMLPWTYLSVKEGSLEGGEELVGRGGGSAC
ncbi:unnamed protein product [Prunus armeniaca]|uniref:Uncharacterized protein n=1 Tax=Prunus armeniaca TaxID=36596 RepID=A0A6J5X7D1_PRUAR|nr:unnamed protein product [Prunus armeniaca]